MAGNLETEFKLRTARSLEIALVDAALRESGFGSAGANAKRHNDIYLDDAARSLAQSGIGLRVRVGRTGSTVTCKHRGERAGALFVREELEAEWRAPTTPPTAAELPQPLRDAVEPVVLRRPLIPVLRLDVARDLRKLSYDGRELCELAIDHVQAHGAGRSVEFTEIELEVLDDVPSCERLAAHLEERLHIQPANNDKPTHAARLLGLSATNGAHTVGAGALTAAAVRALLRRQVANVQRAETQVRQSTDEQHVHLMRTTLRRLRSMVAAFRKLWPDSESRLLRAHLQALAAELGRVRDLDVMVRRLPAEVTALPPPLQPAAERILEWMRRARTLARTDLVAWLRSPERLADAQRFADLLPQLDASTALGGEPIADAARQRLTLQTDKLRRRSNELTDDAPMAAFHSARIAAKRLRYLLEELAEHVPDDIRKVGKRLGKLQEALGELCDDDTAVRHLLEWAPRILADCGDDPLVGPALGALAQRRHAAIEQHRPAALEGVRREHRRLRLPS
ncbi:MAG: CHAD domain-containing protein [Planctomycetes bacterium]|nr:CHAD domain-containing protein [Planctomycetota bacterium]